MSCAGFLMWKWHLSKKGTFLSCMCRLVTFVLLDILSSLVGRKGYNNFWGINPSYCTQWDESKPSWKSSSCIQIIELFLEFVFHLFMKLHFSDYLKFWGIPIIIPVFWKELPQGKALVCQFLGKLVCTSRWFWMASFPSKFSFSVSNVLFILPLNMCKASYSLKSES